LIGGEDTKVQALGPEIGQAISEPAKLIGPMLARFMASDRTFAKMLSAGETTHLGSSLDKSE
jgi:hypothetical protein